MKYTLTINDPKTGWSNATDVEATSPEHAYELVKEYQEENKKLQFGLVVIRNDSKSKSKSNCHRRAKHNRRTIRN